MTGGFPEQFARLHIKTADGSTATKDVLRPTTLVGTMEQCNLQLLGAGIGPAHCAITVESGDLLLYDLRTRSGTLLNGSRIDVAALNDQDVIRVGDFECRIETNIVSRLDAADFTGSTARLNIATRDGRSVAKDVLRPATLVGALVGCNIQLVGPGISAVHCLMTLHRGRLRVRDLRTGAGTRLNSRAIAVGTLNDGDLLAIGSFSARVESSLGRIENNPDDQFDGRFQAADVIVPGSPESTPQGTQSAELAEMRQSLNAESDELRRLSEQLAAERRQLADDRQSHSAECAALAAELARSSRMREELEAERVTLAHDQESHRQERADLDVARKYQVIAGRSGIPPTVARPAVAGPCSIHAGSQCPCRSA